MRSTVLLRDVLLPNETVIFSIIKGKEDGVLISSILEAEWRVDTLRIMACPDVPSMIGMNTGKPGKIMHLFMNALYDAGIITRLFEPSAWRMGYVVRNGERLSLDQLRRMQRDPTAVSADTDWYMSLNTRTG